MQFAGPVLNGGLLVLVPQILGEKGKYSRPTRPEICEAYTPEMHHANPFYLLVDVELVGDLILIIPRHLGTCAFNASLISPFHLIIASSNVEGIQPHDIYMIHQIHC